MASTWHKSKLPQSVLLTCESPRAYPFEYLGAVLPGAPDDGADVAKAKQKPQENPPKKKRGLAAIRRARRAKAAKRNPAPAAANPPIAVDFTHVLLPGFGAYGLTRVLQRIVYTLVQKRWPKLGKHAHAAAGVVSFGGVWFLGHRIKRLEPFHDGIVMGSGIAALQGIAQTYLPKKYSWLLSDCRPEDVAPAKPQNQLPPTTQQQLAPAEGDDEYSYLEEQLDALERSGSRRVRSIPPPKAKGKPVASAMHMAAGADDGAELDPDLFEELGGEDIDDLYSGAFSTN